MSKEPQTTSHDEKHLKGLAVEDLLDRLPQYAQIISHPWPQDTGKDVLGAWVHGAHQASDHIKDIIQRWREVNAE